MTSIAATTSQEQASAVLAFAEDLQAQISLTAASPPNPLTITDDALRTLNKYLDQLPFSRTSLPISTRRRLDLKGTELWNTCMRIMALCGENNECGSLSNVQALAFVMLDAVAPFHGSGNLRALELALRTARDCLDNKHLKIALKALEAAAARLDALERSESSTDGSKQSIATTEYYMLRIYLSWLQGRVDIAEHLFSKTTTGQYSQEQRRVIIEICYIIGVSALSNNRYEMAVDWLGRALEAGLWIDQTGGQLDLALKDLRLLGLHAFVRAHLQLDAASSRHFIHESLTTLKTEYRDILPVILLRLDVIGREDQPDCDEYSECLKAVMRLMELTSESLKVAFHHVQRLGNYSHELSMEALQQLLIEKIVPSNNGEWIGQYFVASLWILPSSNQSVLDIFAGAAEKLTDRGCSPLSEEATHASLALIWRRVENIISSGDLSAAEKWCHFVLNQAIFQNCSKANRAIFQRKLITCASNNPNTSLARDTLDQILYECHDTPSTLYLAYQVTLRRDHLDLGAAILEALYKLGTYGIKYMLSCAAEAQRFGRSQKVISCLQRAISVIDYGDHEGLEVQGLFHSAIDIISTELNRYKATDADLLNQICHVFEAALKATKRESSSETSSLLPMNEIEWLSRRGYNMALQLVKSSFHDHGIRLLDISMKLADSACSTGQVPGYKNGSNVVQHHLSCYFLKAIALVSKARINVDPVKKKTTSHDIRTTVQHTRTIWTHLQSQNETSIISKWQKNYRILVSFDFEAAVLLKQWDCLPSIIGESSASTDDKLCNLFMDSILASAAPVDVMTLVVMKIINTLHTSPSPSLNTSTAKTKTTTTLPRHLRCLFHLSLTANEIPLAEAIIDKVLSLASGDDDNNNGHSTGTDGDYPNEELEWLATVTFNRAVDFYLAGADEECRRWAVKAIEVADLVKGPGAGVLGKLLRGNLAKLP